MSKSSDRRGSLRLKTYLETSFQALIAVSPDGIIRLANQPVAEMFRYEASELLGQRIEMLLPERYQAAHGGHLRAYFSQPSERPMGAGRDLVGRRKDNTEFPVEIDLRCTETGTGILAIAVIIDITGRKRTESELERVNAELLRSNSELAQFAYVASHDLQEPLRTITAYLHLLEKRYQGQLDEEATEFIRYAVDGAVRMKNLVHDLLRLSRAGSQSMNFSEVETQAVLDAACANLELAIEESEAVVTADPLPALAADAGLLTQVFQNLIGNALRFRAPAVPPRIHISAREQPGVWVFSVQDNGIGIQSQYFERIFRLFERLHGVDEYGGSGVGLAITQRIVERHGGRVWVKESEVGQGSIFSFSLPSRALAKRASSGNS